MSYCCILHDYEKWVNVTPASNALIGLTVLQSRVCRVCGLMRLRRITV